jgi:hypothetical protein
MVSIGTISTISQAVSIADGGGGITDLSHSWGGVCSSVSWSGNTQTMSVADCGGGITDLSHSWGGDQSWGGVSYLGNSRSCDNGWGGSGVAEPVPETQGGGGITDLRHGGGGIPAVVRSGVADLRYVRDGGRSCYSCHSGGGGVAKAVAVSAISTVAKTNYAALLRFLLRLFSSRASDDGQHDASLWESRAL